MGYFFHFSSLYPAPYTGSSHDCDYDYDYDKKNKIHAPSFSANLFNLNVFSSE